MKKYLDIVKNGIKEALKDAPVVAGDVWIANQGESGLGFDWSQGSLLFKGSNIAWNFASYTKPLGGSLYEFDKDGYMRRKDGNTEDPYPNQFNDARRQIKEAVRRALEEEFRRALPSTEYLPFLDPMPAIGVNMCYRDAKGWRQPVDPLMLDLDG